MIIMESHSSIFRIDTLSVLSWASCVIFFALELTSVSRSAIGEEIFSVDSTCFAPSGSVRFMTGLASRQGITASHKKLRSVKVMVGVEKLDTMQRILYEDEAREL